MLEWLTKKKKYPQKHLVARKKKHILTDEATCLQICELLDTYNKTGKSVDRLKYSMVVGKALDNAIKGSRVEGRRVDFEPMVAFSGLIFNEYYTEEVIVNSKREEIDLYKGEENA